MHNPESTPRSAISTSIPAPEPFILPASDGYPLKGFYWRHAAADSAARAVVIINPATSVACRYYFRFAGFFFRNGFDVIAYDYRGIGGSRPAKLRGFDASWVDWGYLDFDAVLSYAKRSFSDQPIDVVAHSAGGFVLGFAKANHLIRRIFTVGAQYAYWRDGLVQQFARQCTNIGRRHHRR
jgi:predicted alpha/beta hydrolase